MQKKNLYKFLKNSVFGKTIQNNRKNEICDLTQMKKQKQEINFLFSKI